MVSGQDEKKIRESSRMRRASPSAKFANRIFQASGLGSGSSPSPPPSGSAELEKCWRIFGVWKLGTVCN